MNNVTFTKEELNALVTQVGARIDHLKAIQEEEAKKGNVPRVIELEDFLKPIRAGHEKMTKELYKI